MSMAGLSFLQLIVRRSAAQVKNYLLMESGKGFAFARD
jgi:hypothetical protein